MVERQPKTIRRKVVIRTPVSGAKGSRFALQLECEHVVFRNIATLDYAHCPECEKAFDKAN